MKYIYLSPHLDDAVLSCGGIMWEQVQQGDRVQVWTFATKDVEKSRLSPFAKMLHARWGNMTNPSKMRREEDIKALRSLGCGWIHLDFTDSIYRVDQKTGEPLIQKVEDLFSPDHQIDIPLVDNMIQSLETKLKELPSQNVLKGSQIEPFQLISPLAVGGHIDHRNTRAAAEKLGVLLHYYADFPYAALDPLQVEACLPKNSAAFHFPISDDGLAAWQNAIACYASQISSFWSTMDEMKAAVADYARQPLACTFWKKKIKPVKRK